MPHVQLDALISCYFYPFIYSCRSDLSLGWRALDRTCPEKSLFVKTLRSLGDHIGVILHDTYIDSARKEIKVRSKITATTS